MSEIKVGDKVSDGRRSWVVVKLDAVCGIPAADLHPIRKDGTTGVVRTKNLHNRPLSILERIEP